MLLFLRETYTTNGTLPPEASPKLKQEMEVCDKQSLSIIASVNELQNPPPFRQGLSIRVDLV
jgi:hypothetical protein